MTLIKTKIFILDDEATMRELLGDFLRSQGYEVQAYSTALEALRALRGTPLNEVGAIISDVRMPPMNGIDFLKLVRRDFPELPVIMVSSFGNAEESQKAKECGAYQYLPRPFSLSKLAHAIEEAIENGVTVRAKAAP